MESIEYAQLAGDWYLQRINTAATFGFMPACHHAMMNVGPDGSFTATEEIGVNGSVLVFD